MLAVNVPSVGQLQSVSADAIRLRDLSWFMILSLYHAGMRRAAPTDLSVDWPCRPALAGSRHTSGNCPAARQLKFSLLKIYKKSVSSNALLLLQNPQMHRWLGSPVPDGWAYSTIRPPSWIKGIRRRGVSVGNERVEGKEDREGRGRRKEPAGPQRLKCLTPMASGAPKGELLLLSLLK